MARAKKELPAEPTIEESAPVEDNFTINDTILLEKIYDLRFVDKNGIVYRLIASPGVASGEYRLVIA